MFRYKWRSILIKYYHNNNNIFRSKFFIIYELDKITKSLKKYFVKN